MTRTADPAPRTMRERPAGAPEVLAMPHPNNRAERRAIDAAHVPAWAARGGTMYHARADRSYTLGARITLDAPDCRMCGIDPVSRIGEDRCDACIADAVRRNVPASWR